MKAESNSGITHSNNGFAKQYSCYAITTEQNRYMSSPDKTWKIGTAIWSIMFSGSMLNSLPHLKQCLPFCKPSFPHCKQYGKQFWGVACRIWSNFGGSGSAIGSNFATGPAPSAPILEAGYPHCKQYGKQFWVVACRIWSNFRRAASAIWSNFGRNYQSRASDKGSRFPVLEAKWQVIGKQMLTDCKHHPMVNCRGDLPYDVKQIRYMWGS